MFLLITALIFMFIGHTLKHAMLEKNDASHPIATASAATQPPTKAKKVIRQV